MPNRVAIVGAGIGGLATAIALRRAGIAVEVYEAHANPAKNADDAFLSLAANGLRALDNIGCRELVVDHGFAVPTITLWSGRAKPLGTMPFAGSEYDELAGLTIGRGRMVSTLIERARGLGVPVNTGKRLVNATPTAHGVVARFIDGSEVESDVLIGADGIHSALRSIIDPDAPAPRYTGLFGFGGRANPPVHIAPSEFNMVFGKRAFFGYTREPGGQTWWFANVPAAPEPTRDELAAVSPTEWKRRLIELFADDATPAAEIISATEHDLHPRISQLVPHVPTWHRDGMLIIGDAAHCASPSSGQGASMAIEDAVTVARCLSEAETIPDALRVFENRRRDRVERVVKHGSRGARSKTLGPIGRLASEALMPVIFRRMASRRTLGWLYDYDVAPTHHPRTSQA
ncbi:FAD-dependent monooxygenase [Nocardia sp. NPDC046763]|uniref:FAD-dependent monooxygenase n=1 Tax=Nocardia sp. NPDC046763 TaxID=3155256 RepID=UPI0033DA1190